MWLLQARAAVPLNEIDAQGLGLTWPHLSPVQHDLRVEVLHLVEIDEFVSLQTLQKVEVHLQARGNAHYRNDHAQATIVSNG